mgnify:CR=1 FL=1
MLNKANHRFREDRELRDRVRFALNAGGLDYKGTVRVRHFLDVLVNDLGQEAIGRHVVKRLAGLEVAITPDTSPSEISMMRAPEARTWATSSA